MKRFLSLAILMIATKMSIAQDSITIRFSDLKIYPVLWMQTSAEYRALCYQAFNTAKAQLDAISKRRFRKKKLAIVTDIDETFLNNSYLEANQILAGRSYSDTAWKRWTDQSSATALPGSIEFFQYAKKKGATIFYVSNRTVKEVSSTLINLQKLGLPDADTTHMLFLSNTSSKEARRQRIDQDYEIVLMLGDNLNDFAEVFEKRSIEERFAATDSVKEAWGKRFIVLPNATYGEWENALFNYNHRLTDAQKLALLRALLIGFH